LAGSGVYSTWSIENCVDKLNDLRISAISGAVWKDPETGKETSVSGSRLIWEMVRDYLIPTFRLIIKADWLGIWIPAGQPKIVEITTTPIDSQSGYGYVNVKAKNIGTDAGIFDFKVTCPSPWEGSSVTEYFNPGEEKTVSIGVRGSCTAEETKTCSVEVKDRASGSYETKSFSLKCLPVVACTPDTTECIYNIIRKCNPYGRWEIIDTCPIGQCAYIANKWRCEYKDDDADGVLNKDDKCPDTPGRVEYQGCPAPKCEWWDILCWLRLIYETLKAWFWVLVIGIIAIVVILFLPQIIKLVGWISKKVK
jgi:hypothetical protein